MTMDNLPRRDITREEARRRTDEFKVHTEVWLEELTALYVDQVWYALDYETCDEYCAGRVRVDTAATGRPHRGGADPARRGPVDQGHLVGTGAGTRDRSARNRGRCPKWNT